MSFTPRRNKYEIFPIWAWVCLGIAVLSAIILLVARKNVAFATFFNSNISGPFRAILAFITNLVPFSLAELFIIFIPIIIAVLILHAVKKRSESIRSILVYSATLISAASLFFSAFVFSFGVGYHTPTLYDRFDIPSDGVSTDQLRASAIKLAEKINDLTPFIDYNADGASVMPYTFSKMNDLLNESYAEINHKYDFIQGFKSRIKPVLLSVPMSYTHLTGIYSVFTGEANVNVDFPDYTLPYTAAHELAHQRGISRENEANFVAFLVTKDINDPYIQYCAYLNMFEYVASALRYADAEAFNSVYSRLSSEAQGELSAYSEFFSKYRGSKAGEVSEAINNAYLIANGTTEGTKSYGLVVDLTVAYLEGAFDEK